LGGLVQPLVEAGEDLPVERSIRGICYRPEQSKGRIQLVAYPQGQPEKSVALFDDSIKTGGKHPGSELYELKLKVLEGGNIEVTAMNLQTGLCLLTRTVHVPANLSDLPEVDCPGAEELDSRLLAVHAEVMMRWFRGLLREREVRVGTRDIVYETRDATTALEEAIDSGDVDLLRQQISVLRHYGDEVCRRTQCSSFPEELKLLFFPEAS
jgi:hypothetical protein